MQGDVRKPLEQVSSAHNEVLPIYSYSPDAASNEMFAKPMNQICTP